MTVLSILRRGLSAQIKNGDFSICKVNSPVINGVRNSGGYDPRRMYIHPTNWHWNKFKDLLHFYFMLGFIPLATLVTYVNITVGPAQLREIPEDYEPKNWEYYKNPIERWFARHVYPSHEEEYERFMQVQYEEHEKAKMREIAKKVKWLRERRQDSKDAPSFQTIPLDYLKGVRKEYDFELRNLGDR